MNPESRAPGCRCVVGVELRQKFLDRVDTRRVPSPPHRPNINGPGEAAHGATVNVVYSVLFDASGTLSLTDAADRIDGGGTAKLTPVSQTLLGRGAITGFGTIDLEAGSAIEAHGGTLERAIVSRAVLQPV